MGIPKITQMAINAAISGGGGKREGTAIPAGQAVERIYFNTSNTAEETNALLSQLTYVQTPFMEYPLCFIYANRVNIEEVGGTGDYGSFIVAIKNGDKEYWLSEVTNVGAQEIHTFYNSAFPGWAQTNGWRNEVKYDVFPTEFETSSKLCITSMFVHKEVAWATSTALTESNGLPIGAENEKIKNVLSITPF